VVAFAELIIAPLRQQKRRSNTPSLARARLLAARSSWSWSALELQIHPYICGHTIHRFLIWEYRVPVEVRE
jgi:hypothetical protein